MQIKEVCSVCGLTRKAVEYYEGQGLIRPRILENSYRDYGDLEIATLKEIAVLRECGIGVKEIRTILESENKSVALSRCRHLSELRMERFKTTLAYMDSLIENYDIEAGFNSMCQNKALRDGFTVRERLVMAFPGNYGIYMSLHFGRFLDIHIETPEQQEAYDNIIAYLDGVPATIPDELGEYLENVFRAIAQADIYQLENAIHEAQESVSENIDTLYKKIDVDEYITYRLSDEFKQSKEGQMVRLMIEFQKSSGYQDVFIKNLKMLSPDYEKYLQRLEQANEQLLQKYPQLKVLYDTP